MDPEADVSLRRSAMQALLDAGDKDLAPLLHQLVAVPNLQGPAIRGLAGFDDPATPEKILAVYAFLSERHQREALNTLSARGSFATALLAAIEKGDVPHQALTADLVRQLSSLRNERVNSALAKLRVPATESGEDKRALIDRYKALVHRGDLAAPDPVRGRQIFARICGACHVLFGDGGKIGPDLTGSNRADLDYILQNILDPNAVIPDDFRVWTVETRDDRVVTGIVQAQDERSVTVLTSTESLVLPRAEIVSLRRNELSMMPEGLLDPLSDTEVRDLIQYLRGGSGR